MPHACRDCLTIKRRFTFEELLMRQDYYRRDDGLSPKPNAVADICRYLGWSAPDKHFQILTTRVQRYPHDAPHLLAQLWIWSVISDDVLMTALNELDRDGTNTDNTDIKEFYANVKAVRTAVELFGKHGSDLCYFTPTAQTKWLCWKEGVSRTDAQTSRAK